MNEKEFTTILIELTEDLTDNILNERYICAIAMAVEIHRMALQANKDGIENTSHSWGKKKENGNELG